MSKRTPSALDAHQVQFVQLIRENSRRHHVHQVFADFCELAALSISNSIDRLQREAREARYLDVIKRYERDEVERFPHMLACVTGSLEICMKDCLGQLFMELDLGNHWQGQFFTPFEISTLMAQMTLGSISQEDIDALGGFILVGEPSVGAGGMVVALARVLAAAQLNYQRCMHVTAQDIDQTAVHMAVIQLSLLHIPAIVIHGDTLRAEERAHWVTPAHVLGGWDYRLRRRHSTVSATAAGAEVTPALAGQRVTIVAERVRAAEQLHLF